MQTDTSKIIHRVVSVWQIVISASVLVALFFLVFTSWVLVPDVLDGIRTYEVAYIFIAFVSVFFYVFLIYIGISGLSIYAVTSPFGIEYHGMGIHIHTSWENTAQIKLVGIAARLGIGPEVLQLREPPQILSSTWLGRFFFRYQKGISLLEFGNWRSSPLGSEIRKYAPKLLP